MLQVRRKGRDIVIPAFFILDNPVARFSLSGLCVLRGEKILHQTPADFMAFERIKA